MMALAVGLLLAALVVLIALFVRAGVDEESEEEAESVGRVREDAPMRPLLLGINYLLSDAPDAALKSFIEAARMHGDAVEIYMALGEMFRARGEYMRAVRIHQNLLARPDLNEEQRFAAAWALAVDFHRGGFLDRALRQYARVLEMRPDHLPALRASLRIREDAGEWDEALALLARIERLEDTPQALHRAYLLAQKAHDAQAAGDHEHARQLAEDALAEDAGCGLAHLVRMRLALADGDSEALVRALEDWAAQAPDTLAAGLAEAVQAEEAMRARVRDWLGARVRAKKAHEDWVLAWLEGEERKQAEADRRAWGFTPKTLHGWLRLLAATREGEDGDFARTWREGAPDWRCAACGVELREIRWRCPQCHAWGTMRPIEEEPCRPA